MILRKLKLKNIRSYRELEIEFLEGATLLSGDIGSGKTSILLALQFALFGLQPGQKGGSLIKAGENEAEVKLEFEIGKNQIKIERAIKRSKHGSISQDANIITINGSIEELSTSESKNRVISLLNYPKEFAKKSNLLYKYTVYTPQEAMKEIIEENAEIRLDTLRHIFGIDRYKRIKENSAILLQKIKDALKIKEVEIRDINVLKERINLDNEKKIRISKEINSLNQEFIKVSEIMNSEEKIIKEIESKIKEESQIKLNLAKTEVEMRGKKEIRNKAEKEIEMIGKQLKDKIDFSIESLNELSGLVLTHKKKLDELNSLFIKINSEISVLLSKKENAFELREQILKLENCPTCFQSVDTEHKDKISKKTQYDLEDINRELEPRISQRLNLIKDIEREKETINDYEKDKQEIEKAKIRFQHQKDLELKLKSEAIIFEIAEIEIKEMETKIKSLREQLLGYAEIEKDYEAKKADFDLIKRKIRDYEIGLAQKNKEVELIKYSIEETEKEISRMEKIKERANYLRSLQDWVEENFLPLISSIESNVLAKLRGDFSKLFGEWFSILVSSSLSVKLDEDFTPVIINSDYEIEYEFLSGGERTAVALAYRLALNQTLNSLLSKINTKELLILDEPTDGFSEQQLDKMRDIFEQLDYKQLILVSHEQKIESFVDNIIRIKKDGVSCVEIVKS